MKRAVPIALGFLLCAAPLVLRSGDTSEAEPRPLPALARWLGPIGNLAAGLQWVRADTAFRRNDDIVGFARAELALALDPGATGTWSLLAQRQMLQRAAPGRGTTPAERRAWIEAGRETLRRGLATARAPEELWFLEGYLLMFCAERDPELGWPGGDQAILQEAWTALDRAAQLGHREAMELAQLVHDVAHDH